MAFKEFLPSKNLKTCFWMCGRVILRMTFGSLTSKDYRVTKIIWKELSLAWALVLKPARACRVRVMENLKLTHTETHVYFSCPSRFPTWCWKSSGRWGTFLNAFSPAVSQPSWLPADPLCTAEYQEAERLVLHGCKLSLQLCPTLCKPCAVTCQAPLSMGFSRQEYWSGLPGPSPGDLPNPGIEPASLGSPALAGEFLTTSATWEAHML